MSDEYLCKVACADGTCDTWQVSGCRGTVTELNGARLCEFTAEKEPSGTTCRQKGTRAWHVAVNFSESQRVPASPSQPQPAGSGADPIDHRARHWQAKYPSTQNWL